MPCIKYSCYRIYFYDSKQPADTAGAIPENGSGVTVRVHGRHDVHGSRVQEACQCGVRAV